MKTQNGHNSTQTHTHTTHHNGHAPAVEPAVTPAVTPDAKVLLKQVASTLGIDEPLTDKQKRSLTPLTRYTDAMLLLIANAYDDHADVIRATFDSATVRDAVAFEQKQRPLAAQTREIADRIDEQIIVRKAEAGELCTALYQTMKGVARLPKGAVLRPIVKQIAAMLRTGKQKNPAIRAPKPPKVPKATASPPAVPSIPPLTGGAT